MSTATKIPEHCIQTVSGKIVDLVNPTYGSLDLWDICYVLGRLCRFNGHTVPFYSVAEHSLLVASLVPECAKLMALLHDASEAYLGDIATPQKLLPDMAGYRERERRMQALIFTKFGAYDVWSPVGWSLVKAADKKALAMETSWYMGGNNPFHIAMRPNEASLALYQEIAGTEKVEPCAS